MSINNDKNASRICYLLIILGVHSERGENAPRKKRYPSGRSAVVRIIVV